MTSTTANDQQDKPQPPLRAKEALVLAAPLFTLAFGRWGAFLGLPAQNLYLPDLILALGALLYLADGLAAHDRTISRRECLRPLFALPLAVAYVLCWAIYSEAPATLVARDAAPFLYLAAAPLMAHALNHVGAYHSMRLLRAACWLHLSWAVPAAVGILPAIQVLPTSIAGQPFFSLRNDVDAVVFVTGILLAAFNAGTRRRLPVSNTLLFAGSLIGLLFQSSRTGIIGVVAGGLSATLVAAPWKRRSGPFLRRLAISALVACVLGFIVELAPSTLPQSGVLARLGVGSGAEVVALSNGAAGTAEARRIAWRLMLEDTLSSPGRVIFGSGPGSDVVARSGAVAHLSGDPTVRAPHSWPVGLFARYGLIGLILWPTAVVSIIRRRYCTSVPVDRSLTTARAVWTGTGLSIGVAALVGVVIESPFGALPFSLVCAGVSATALPRPRAQISQARSRETS